MIWVDIKKIREDAKIPQYKSEDAAGFDISCNETVVVHPGETVAVGTGLAMAIPKMCCLMIVPRSGMALHTSYMIKNSPGIIDPDFRGEICIIVHNLGHSPLLFNKGDRIAQGVLVPVFQAAFIEKDELGDTARGIGGFGSTGVGEEEVACSKCI